MDYFIRGFEKGAMAKLIKKVVKKRSKIKQWKPTEASTSLRTLLEKHYPNKYRTRKRGK